MKTKASPDGDIKGIRACEYCVDLNEKAGKGDLDPLIARAR